MFKRLIHLALALIIALSAAAAAMAGTTGETGNAATPTKTTIIIVVDGLQQSHLQGTQTPNITGLIKSGTTVKKVIDVPENIAGTAACLLTGANDAKKDVLAKFYSTMDKNGVKTVLINGTDDKLSSAIQSASIVKNGPFKDRGSELIKTALKQINPSKNLFCLIILPGPRASQNASKDGQALPVTDNQVGMLLYHLRSNDMLDNTVLVVTGSAGDPPVILNGRGIKEGAAVPAASLADTAATLSYVNNEELRGNGMVFYETLEPNTGDSRSYLLEQRIKELSKAYAQAAEEIDEMRQEQKAVRQQQSQLDSEKAQFTKVIEQQKKDIDGLQFKIKLMKAAGCLLFLLFIIAIYFEYRFLKKRFMFFT